MKQSEAPQDKPARKHGPLSRQERETILDMVQRGVAYEEISRAVGRSQQRVKHLIEGPQLGPGQWHGNRKEAKGKAGNSKGSAGKAGKAEGSAPKAAVKVRAEKRKTAELVVEAAVEQAVAEKVVEVAKPKATRAGKKAVKTKIPEKPVATLKPKAEKVQKAPVATKVEQQPDTQVARPVEHGAGLLQHRFWIRPGVEVGFALPPDFSIEEAQRLVTMIQLLPF